MKKIVFLLFLLVNALSFGQSLNNYKYLVISKKYNFQEEINEYSLNSGAGFILRKQGFEVLFTGDVFPEDLVKNRCKAMYLDIENKSSGMLTKLEVVFKDCENKILFSCQQGTSKEKSREAALNEALQDALNSVKALKYKYKGDSDIEENANAVTEIMLSAKPITNGFKLVDSQNNTIITILKTSNKEVFLADKNGKQGVLISKDYQWFFEYYKDNQFFSEKVKVAF
ncbi:MAG: hypothetical protein ACI7YS_08900 [Flavobacterium sp.]